MNRRTQIRRLRRPAASLLALATLLLAGCQASRKLQDPVLVMETDGGSELGVSTEYGVVFLGRTARSGRVNIAAHFGDGPGIEASVIEPLGGGLFTAETEIRLPVTPMTFQAPDAGQEVVVKGRSGRGPWKVSTRVVSDPDVEGLLLRPTGELARGADQVGAGVYVERDGREYLVGLVSGLVEISRRESGVRRYVTVVGPDQLWRLVTFRRDYEHKRRWVYREDIL